MQKCIETGCDAKQNATRCPFHRRQHDRTRRPTTAQRGYGAAWQRESRESRALRPLCESPLGCTRPSHSKDHTTGLVLCKGHHPTEANGGVYRIGG
jgi:hypothetical protein